MRTRFAPSPTGDLHLGGAFVALASWHLARRAGGSFVVRMEDLDTPRVVRGSRERILEDLAWLGLDFDGPLVVQSERAGEYEEALATLEGRGLTYVCDCSRSEIAREASAPHEGEESVYPGTCRTKDPGRELKRAGAIRLRVPNEVVRVEDALMEPIDQDLAVSVGDFVLRRGDGIFAYQLAVTVDDLAMEVTDVVRGADLLSSTPRQVHLARLLGREPPRYWHLPLVVDAKGERIAKRTPGANVRALRQAGVTKEEILAELSLALGLTAEGLARKPRSPWKIPAAWAALGR
jgi:glutamyl-queuosine tRNA(Asp) synthetase